MMLRAADLGLGGRERPAELDANAALMARIEQLRAELPATRGARKQAALKQELEQEEARLTHDLDGQPIRPSLLDELAELRTRIADLEGRAVSALEQEKHDLAREAAETIAMLEAERETSLEAQRCFETEIARLKRIVRASEARLRDLERGQRIAVATETTARLRDTAADSGQSSLRDAEATLARLRARQKQMEVTEAAMAEIAQPRLENFPQRQTLGVGRRGLKNADQVGRSRQGIGFHLSSMLAMRATSVHCLTSDSSNARNSSGEPPPIERPSIAGIATNICLMP